MDRRGRWLVLLGLLVLACSLAAGTVAAAPPEDPESDVLGWENGYWHNESIAVDQSDGLSEAEREAYVSRTMARVEVIREREFKRSVPVEVIPRSEYSNRTEGNASDAYRAWNNQVWEALFIVGEDENVLDTLHATSTAATTGGYFIAADEIKIITDSPEDVTIDRRTLSHELVHALQDQYFGLSNVTAHVDTQDEEFSTTGLVEGEARYLERRYEQRCGNEWECVDDPTSTGGGSGGEQNRGVLYTLYYPYSDGPPYVNALVERGGWSAIDQAFQSPPNSTEQVTHITDEEPSPLIVEDRATGGWEPFAEQGHDGTDTLGEASIFMLLWYQAWQHDADTMRSDTLFEAEGTYDLLNYESVPSAGWGNDVVRPYRKESVSGGTEYGYVWTTEWDTEADATQFQAAYHAVLRAHDARQIGPHTWVIDSGSFADAFRVVKDGTRVTIVNAPEAGDLDALRPDLPADYTTQTASPTGRDSPDQRVDEPTPTPDDESTQPVEQPGFGVVAALAAIVVAGLAGRWWRRDRP